MESTSKRARIEASGDPSTASTSLGLDGLVVVNKPSGWTSFDVVAKIRGTLERMIRAEGGAQIEAVKRSRRQKNKFLLKVGHGGTLDPAATGVLVVGVGSATKTMHHFLSGSKRYVTVAKFGEVTDTLDGEGQVVDTRDYKGVTREVVERALVELTGDIQQVPPAHSAIRKDGKRSYERARAGEEVVMDPRTVTIHSIVLNRFEPPEIELEVECGGGTYIRSLIRDLAEKVGTVGYMKRLVRTKQGPLVLDGALEEADLSDPEKILLNLKKHEAYFQERSQES